MPLMSAVWFVLGQVAAIEAVAADLAVIHGPVQQRNAVLGAGFGEHVAHMVVDRALADR